MSEPAVELQSGVRVPLRDGIQLSATLYQRRDQQAPRPAICTLTPYIAQNYHDLGLYFARHGFAFLVVDVRGRGNSEGTFRPFIQEAQDGYDVVEWLAKQPYCSRQVAMWGGSYAGYAQWAVAKEFPPHLKTIVPVAAPYMGVDFPMRNNIFSTYLIRWLALVWGRTSQEKIFADDAFWRQAFRRWFESGQPFRTLDTVSGFPSPSFQQWIAHPQRDEFWDVHNPSSEQYSCLKLPILTMTGIYDGDQPGALMHYREHMRHATHEDRARHYLVIGPWDHAGLRTPRQEVAGLKLGTESVIDPAALQRRWYDWILRGHPKPEFLEKNVTYYVTGAEEWRYADTLAAVTVSHRPMFLASAGNAAEGLHSGSLVESGASGMEDHFVIDPSDRSYARIEADSSDPLSTRPTFPTDNLTSQHSLYGGEGKQLCYHSAPFDSATEISGFFKLTAWIGIDRPDADLTVTVYEVGPDGGSVLLAADCMRLRYRESLYQSNPIQTREPLSYEFQSFTFASRRLGRGSRLRLTIGPSISIHFQRNNNSGGVVSQESIERAQLVTVRLFHDVVHASTLYVPIGLG